MGKHSHHWLTKKKVLTIGGIVLLLLAAAGAGMAVWLLQNRSSLQGGASPFSQQSEKKLPPAVDNAQNLALEGKTDQANQQIQQALNQSGVSDQQKAQLLVQEGVNYTNSNQPQKALDVFLQAEKLQSDFTTSHLIGEQYEVLGNKDLAIQYYKKAITQLDPKSIGYNGDKTTYEDKIKALGGQP